ncbi:hypothetical protein AMJ51_02115 [Microgenomates bacterium DG_75]|nr:MAG: hypothetical protein AMJ51_02115 [Microgenomates bacterium DG_75]
MKNVSLQRLILVFLLIGLFFLFFLPPDDPDLGWQLRYGQQIWQQREIPRHNQLSVFLEDYYWSDARALYQLPLFLFYQFLDLFGLSLFNSLLMVASIFIFLSLSGQKELKIISLPLIIFLSWVVLGFGIRNQLLSFFFLFLLIKLIELTNQKKFEWFSLTPLVMILWTNSHGGFILGVALLFIFAFEKTVWLFIKPRRVKNYFKILAIVLLSIGATLLNPFGYQVYLEALRHFSIVPLSRLIAEWVPPHPWLQLAICLFLAIALWSIYQTRKKPLTIFKLLILIAFAYLALKARRDLAYFFFFAAFVISSIKVKSKHFQSLALLASMLILFIGPFFRFPQALIVNRSWQRSCQISHSCPAVEFLKKQPEKGNIFNAYEQGGLLIWLLPEYKVFVDGRMPAWQTPSGKSPYTIYLETLQTQPGWQETLEEYNINWLYISPGTFMDLRIRDNPQEFGWQEVYRGKTTVIYKKI